MTFPSTSLASGSGNAPAPPPEPGQPGPRRRLPLLVKDAVRRWRAIGSPGRITLYFLLLLLSALFGCSMLNRYIFIPKEEIVATPEKYRIPFQEIWFNAKDGTKLNGWLLPGVPGRPLLLFFHGNAGNLSDNLEYLNLLHGKGFSIFIFDYRGFGRSSGEPFTEDDLYQDGRGALSYLRGIGWRSENMIFFGQSLGSAVALQMALEQKPRGLVLEGSFTSMKEMVKHVSPIAYYTVGWWGIRLPFDNLAKIGRLEVPLLLIHGDRDGVVPFAMTLRLYAKAPWPKRLHIIAGGGHCDVFTRDTAAYLTAWGNYLQAIPQRTARP